MRFFAPFVQRSLEQRKINKRIFPISERFGGFPHMYYFNVVKYNTESSRIKFHELILPRSENIRKNAPKIGSCLVCHNFLYKRAVQVPR